MARGTYVRDRTRMAHGTYVRDRQGMACVTYVRDGTEMACGKYVRDGTRMAHGTYVRDGTGMAHMWEMMNTCMVSVGKPEEKQKTLKWPLKEWDDKPLTGLIWLKIRISGRLLQNGNEPCGSVKCGKFHDCLQNY
jgi:hypothetical protein